VSLDHADLSTQRIVHTRHLQADDPAADDQKTPGVGGSSSAPVESITRGSSGTNGKRIASEPAAMMQCSNRIRSFLSPWLLPWLTSNTCGLMNLPTPRTTSTLRLLGQCREAASESLDDAALPVAQLLEIDFSGAPNSIPRVDISCVSSITLAACNSALDGMHPTFRQTPPSISQRSTRITFKPDPRRETQPCTHRARNPAPAVGVLRDAPVF